MKGKAIVISGTLIVLLVALWWLYRQSSLPVLSPSTPPRIPPTPSAVLSPEERRKAVVEQVESLLSTPITFYGKVVDQDGYPVAGADVGYSALDTFMQPGSSYRGKSDETGLFSITGIKGARLSVNVRKEGYYFIDGKSNAAFAYGSGPDGYFREPPSQHNPAVFVLQKAGATDPLIHVSGRSYRIPRNGAPVEVDLTTGQRVVHGTLRVEAWTEDHSKDTKQHYNWRCRVTVPNGGLVTRQGQFDFEAPLAGYRPSDELVMLQTADEWQPQIKREYFIKLPNEIFGRLTFYMVAQGDHFFEIESHLNPQPGNRNLEFDPKKTVKSQKIGVSGTR